MWPAWRESSMRFFRDSISSGKTAPSLFLHKQLDVTRAVYMMADEGQTQLQYAELSEHGGAMPKYLWEASYSAEGAKGLLKDGGSKRRKAAEEAVKAVGGKLEAFYFAFGKYDAYVIADIPDHVSVAAASLAVNASGAVAIRTTVLLTPEELDKASKKSVSYSPPGR